MQAFVDPPPIPQLANMDMLISVGFGDAYVTKDREEIFKSDSDDICFEIIENDGVYTIYILRE